MQIIQTYQTDWLNSMPVYYNTKTHRVALNMNDVVDWTNFEFDPEGLYNYLRYGYQILEQTPIKHVKFLRHSSKLTLYLDDKANPRYQIEHSEDPIDAIEKKTTDVSTVTNLLQSRIRKFEEDSQAHNKRFLLPLSGGYDSRLLALFINEKQRIDAFTYDISLNGRFCFETVWAQEVCKRLGIRWNLLHLTDYFQDKFVEKNFDLFCLEMPIHACYHMEMYEQIKSSHLNDYIVLSGSVGDWWNAFKVPINPPRNPLDFDGMFFNHGISIPTEFIQIKTSHEVKTEFFEKNASRLSRDDIYRIVTARRGRMGLATYIYRTANQYFETFTPYYDFEIAIAQLLLPEDQKHDRSWIKALLAKNNLDVESMPRQTISYNNIQDAIAMSNALTKDIGLDPKHFRGLVSEDRVSWINSQISTLKGLPISVLRQISLWLYSQGLFNDLRLSNRFESGVSTLWNLGIVNKAIAEWTVLKPLELAMRKANA